MVRKELIDLIKKNGGKHSATKFDYLITNHPEDATAKRKKAEDIGAEVITEEEFFEIYASLSGSDEHDMNEL
jgi:NAD-dependent DNA ligase